MLHCDNGLVVARFLGPSPDRLAVRRACFATVAGLVVKARVAIPVIWSGEYEPDAALEDREDRLPQNARNLIDNCLALADVGWWGRSVGTVAPVASKTHAYDLSRCTLLQLVCLHEVIESC